MVRTAVEFVSLSVVRCWRSGWGMQCTFKLTLVNFEKDVVFAHHVDSGTGRKGMF